MLKLCLQVHEQKVKHGSDSATEDQQKGRGRMLSNGTLHQQQCSCLETPQLSTA